jgi:dephospho-CoA kinase
VKTIGLTGGIGCGKSTVAALLKRYPDVLTFDCDRAAKEIMAQPRFRPILLRIIGPKAIDAEGNLNTKAIADAIFSSDVTRGQLEQAVHPRVRSLMWMTGRKAEHDGIRLFVVESAILFETGLNRLCDYTVCVVCGPNKQRRRLRENRGWTDEQIDARLASQWPLADKMAHADYLVGNDRSEEELARTVDQLYRSPTWALAD